MQDALVVNVRDDDQEEISEEVPGLTSWINTFPRREEILGYIKKIPTPYRSLVLWQTQLEFYRLVKQKGAYFSQATTRSLHIHLSEYEQFDIVQEFARYSAVSVVAKLNEDYPEVGIRDVPSNPPIASWAAAYLRKWRLLTLLMTAPAYVDANVYAKTLLTQIKELDQLEAFQKEFQEIFLLDGYHFEEGGELDPSEKTRVQTVLQKLGFLPDSLIESLLLDEIDRYYFLSQILLILTLLKEYGLEDAKGTPDKFSEALWYELAFQEEDKQLDLAESERLADVEDPTGLVKLNMWFDSLLRADFIQNGEMEKAMRSYMVALPPDRREWFVDLFLEYLPDSNFFQIACSPFSSHLILIRLRRCKNTLQLGDLLSEMATQLPPEREMINRILLTLAFRLRQEAVHAAAGESRKPL